jgi:hypothetical protein
MNTSVDDRNCADLIREELDRIDRANAITGRWMMTFAVIHLSTPSPLRFGYSPRADLLVNTSQKKRGLKGPVSLQDGQSSLGAARDPSLTNVR